MPGSKKDLEPEIQYMVVEALVAELEWLNSRTWVREYRADKHSVLSTLLSFRLTCQSFGQASIIKAAVFKEITLQPTILNFNRLRQTRISSIAPFVKKIKFLPTPFIFHLERRSLTRVLEILSQHESDLPVRCRRHVEIYCGGIPKTAAALSTYAQQAQKEQDLLLCGELQCLWTATLRSFKQANSFELLSLFGRHPLDPSDDPGSQHCWPCFESKRILYDHTGISEGHLLRTAMQCLSAANTQITTISIDRQLAQHFDGWISPSWDLLDLSRLKIFKFPGLGVVGGGYGGGIGGRGAAVENFLAHFLRKPLPSLRKISVDHYVECPRISLPSLSQNSLPRLCSLALGGILLNIPRLAEIVTSCVELEEVTLRDCHPQGPWESRLEDPADAAWQPLFYALSHHPKLRNFTIADQCGPINNINVTGAPHIPNTVCIEPSQVMFQTGLSTQDPEFWGIWDAALGVYLGQQQ